jgi:hypothetical protein
MTPASYVISDISINTMIKHPFEHIHLNHSKRRQMEKGKEAYPLQVSLMLSNLVSSIAIFSDNSVVSSTFFSSECCKRKVPSRGSSYIRVVLFMDQYIVIQEVSIFLL